MRGPILLILVSLCLACSSSGGGGTGGGSGGAGTGGGSGAGGGTGGGSAGGSEALSATVTLIQNCSTTMMNETCTSSMSSYFASAPQAASSACTRTMMGDCDVTVCSLDAGVVMPAPAVSAGTVTVTGTKAGTLTQVFDGGYANLTAMNKLWDGGEMLSVSASGATVPAFSNQTLMAPGPIALTSPACAAGMCGALSRSAPLNVTWTSGSATGTRLTLSSARVGDRSARIQCNFSATSGTVPAAAMAQLGASDAGYTNSMSIISVSTASFDAGAWGVELTASHLRGGSAGAFTTSD